MVDIEPVAMLFIRREIFEMINKKKVCKIVYRDVVCPFEPLYKWV